jgi:hypothetical protein
VLAGVPIAGILGDQQAATFGQACLEPGEAKNTYGTGNFLLLNTGTTPVRSEHGLLTTVCYKLGDKDTVYALEGSVAVTGSLVQWLRDNLGIIKNAKDIEDLAGTVDDNGGVYFVPAFSGLFAPRWRPDARGVISGLTRFANKDHIARAALEATAFQTREVIDAMRADSAVAGVFGRAAEQDQRPGQRRPLPEVAPGRAGVLEDGLPPGGVAPARDHEAEAHGGVRPQGKASLGRAGRIEHPAARRSLGPAPHGCRASRRRD